MSEQLPSSDIMLPPPPPPPPSLPAKQRIMEPPVKKSRVFKIAADSPQVDITAVEAPAAVEPPAVVEPPPPVEAPAAVEEPVVEAAPEPVIKDDVTEEGVAEEAPQTEMWRGIELDPASSDVQETTTTDLDDMPGLCNENCENECDCSALKNNKGLSISAIIEKELENNNADDEAEAEDEAEDEDENVETRPRSISDAIKQTLEDHLIPNKPPPPPDYRFIIYAATFAFCLWRLYTSINTSINSSNEF